MQHILFQTYTTIYHQKTSPTICIHRRHTIFVPQLPLISLVTEQEQPHEHANTHTKISRKEGLDNRKFDKTIGQPTNQATKQPVRRLTEPCRFILWNPTAHKQQHDDTTAEIPTKQQQQQQHTIRRTQQHAHKPELSCLFPLFPFVPWLGSRTTTDNKHQASTVQDTTNPSLSYSHT